MKKQSKGIRIMKFIILLAIFLVFIIPFYLMVLNSFKSTQQFIDAPFKWPEVWNLDNYRFAIKAMDFMRGFGNSLLITVCSTAVIILLSSMCAYLFVRFKWKINKILFMVMVCCMIVPFQALMIPLVKIYGALDLVDNKWVLIFLYQGFNLPFAVFMYHGFIKSIPYELEEAAMLDGCNQYQTFFLIVFPMLRSITLTLVALDFLAFWNDFLLPNLVLISGGNRTLPLSMFNFFSSAHTIEYSGMMAGLLLMMTPVFILYLVLQKYIMEGVTQGAIK